MQGSFNSHYVENFHILQEGFECEWLCDRNKLAFSLVLYVHIEIWQQNPFSKLSKEASFKYICNVVNYSIFGTSRCVK